MSEASSSLNRRALALATARRVDCPNCRVQANVFYANTEGNTGRVFYKCPYFSVSKLEFDFLRFGCFSSRYEMCVLFWRLYGSVGWRMSIFPVGRHHGQSKGAQQYRAKDGFWAGAENGSCARAEAKHAGVEDGAHSGPYQVAGEDCVCVSLL